MKSPIFICNLYVFILSVMYSEFIEFESLLALELVAASQADALAGGEECERAEARTISLDGEGVEIRHQAPLGRELFECKVNPHPAWIRLAAVGD